MLARSTIGLRASAEREERAVLARSTIGLRASAKGVSRRFYVFSRAVRPWPIPWVKAS